MKSFLKERSRYSLSVDLNLRIRTATPAWLLQKSNLLPACVLKVWSVNCWGVKSGLVWTSRAISKAGTGINFLLQAMITIQKELLFSCWALPCMFLHPKWFWVAQIRVSGDRYLRHDIIVSTRVFDTFWDALGYSVDAPDNLEHLKRDWATWRGTWMCPRHLQT